MTCDMHVMRQCDWLLLLQQAINLYHWLDYCFQGIVIPPSDCNEVSCCFIPLKLYVTLLLNLCCCYLAGH